MTESELKLWIYLCRNGKTTQRELIEAGFYPRPLRYQLKGLMKKGKIISVTNWKDLRSAFNTVKNRPTKEEIKATFKVLEFFRDLAENENNNDVQNEMNNAHYSLQIELENYKYDTR